MSHYPYLKPVLHNRPASQWADFTQHGEWWEEVFRLVPVNRIRNKPWSKTRLQSVEEAFLNNIPLLPVELVMDDDGTYLVGDGNHRTEISKLHGLTHVPAIINERHTGKPDGTPPPDLAMELAEREFLMLIETLRANAVKQAQFSWISVSRNGSLFNIGIEIFEDGTYVEGTISVEKRADSYIVNGRWHDNSKDRLRVTAKSHKAISSAISKWIGRHESATRVSSELLRVAEELLA